MEAQPLRDIAFLFALGLIFVLTLQILRLTGGHQREADRVSARQPMLRERRNRDR